MLSLLSALHDKNAFLIIFSALLCGLWGIGAHWSGRPVGKAYALALMGAETLVVVQALMGMGMAFYGLRPSSVLHMLLYGPLSLLALPAAYLYSRRHKPRRLPLVFGLTCLFLFGLSVRATFTG